ncbi:DNA polymerase III subunit alpha [Rubrobacter radiotolerans]|uniref:DNA-directed DNA polymerase n=1 Tax=Rubrobacter radiotolerans TaxID=42256 RepID=A0AB35T6G7_RUBRA|nr:DNA polymerase III subunit alpha [Rubrobacter radiotolerans]MDX5895147.1 DNA polymerase III subunit alpha [Rubrobacter radiotolerans]SMC07542.1 error-prone DNA polymerase [Rubrobacter radiotolerans DSM 5868]
MFTHQSTHLHVRSGYSWGYGTARPEELVRLAAEIGMKSLALTDQDSLFGVPTFLESCSEYGIAPIVGAEITMEDCRHLVLLAKSEAGYRNLCRLITSYRCSSEDRRRPHCSVERLLENAEGLICLTGAIPFGYISAPLLSNDTKTARHRADTLREAFGDGRLYVEITNDLTAGSRRRVSAVHRFARECGLPTVAANEVAYLVREDHRLHEVLAAASSLSPLPPPDYRPTDQLYLKDSRKMMKPFEGYPDALRNTEAIAERCAGVVSSSGKVHMPTANLKYGERTEKKLVRLATAGARRRYSEGEMPEVKRRLRRELSCIFALGFAPYFLLAREAVEIAKTEGLPVTGRGSSANSLVAHCLGITQPEPLSNRLLFERFLHEERIDPPDIDLDFSSTGREIVRNELVRRYEHLGVAETATVSTLSLRGAVRVAARALGHSPTEINALSKGVPSRFTDREHVYNSVSGWDEALFEPSMRGHRLQDRERYSLLLDLSWRLRGKLHQAGTHSGGLVFGTDSLHLSEIVPLEPSGIDGLLRVQADKDDLELLGLPKLDLLVLRIHDALHHAGELVSKRLSDEGKVDEGQKINPLSPPLEDKETYALIRTGKNIGMFQVESPGQMHLSQRLKPRRFEDLVAQISLFRPGPVRGDLVTPYVLRRNGLEPYRAITEKLEEVLRPTYGVLVYQEQVLEVAQAVAGFSFKEGDLLRRAMTKDRGPGAMDSIREEFTGRAMELRVPEREAGEVFGWIEGFSGYGFPKAHAASFAAITYASAYMRRHYPAEFFTGILDSQPMGFFSPRTVLNEARRVGVGILQPDIHLSGRGFTVEDGGSSVRVGLSYCKGLSLRAMDSILEEREKSPFVSVADLYRRTDVERDSLENLIRGSYLDTLANGSPSRTRGKLLAEASRLPKKKRRSGQDEIPVHPASWWFSSKSSVEYLPASTEDTEQDQWNVLGLNVSSHPLTANRKALTSLGAVAASEVMSFPSGTSRSQVRVAGLLETLQRPPTKSGRVVHFLLIEDESGVLQATIFEDVYRKYGHVLHESGSYLLDGVVERDRRRGASYLVSRIQSLDAVLQGTAGTVPDVVAAGSGAFVRARRRDRRAG